MQKLRLAGLSLLSGLLMGIAWPATGGLSLLFFGALVPLLYVEHVISLDTSKLGSRHVFYNAYLTFFTFNVFTSWWIWNASAGGMVMTVMVNTLFMSITFLMFHAIKRQLGSYRGYFGLLVLWLGFEWVHFNWELAHPWLTFGNVFADSVQLVQWYEYTGVLGGSLWVLLTNILFFHLYKNFFLLKLSFRKNISLFLYLITILILPTFLSMYIYYDFEEVNDPIEAVVVQPNVDPYYDKFNRMTEAEQVDRIIQLTKQKITANTKYVVTPETALPRGGLESELEFNYGIREIRKLITTYPDMSFLVGLSSYINYNPSGKKPTSTARPNKRTGGWYDAYNSAAVLTKSDSISIYHKSKLVIGVEKVPYPQVFGIFERFALDLGGTVGSLGTQEEPSVFINEDVSAAPLICYESVFGEYFSEFVKKGANVAFIITNDGWWGDTPGYRQHLAYARLRAIESRRSIARSANTGTSCFIDQKGNITQPTKWWEEAVIKQNININNRLTYYSKNGDYLGRVAAFLAILLLLWSWSLKWRNKSLQVS